MAGEASFTIIARATVSGKTPYLDELNYLPIDPLYPVQNIDPLLRMRLYDMHRQYVTLINKLVDRVNTLIDIK